MSDVFENEIDLEEELESEQDEWQVYLLVRLDQGKNLVNQATTYIGFTPRTHRRLRKHLTIVTGGARRTRGHVWGFVCVVKGFKTKQEALSFEWHWQKHNFKRTCVGKRTKRNGRVVKRMAWRHKGGKLTMQVRLQYLQEMLNDKQYAHLHIEHGCGNIVLPWASPQLLSNAAEFYKQVPPCSDCQEIYQEHQRVIMVRMCVVVLCVLSFD